MFSRSGYNDLLGTLERFLLRPSGNIMIISRRCKRGSLAKILYVQENFYLENGFPEYLRFGFILDILNL